jgi:hypothetical protein
LTVAISEHRRRAVGGGVVDDQDLIGWVSLHRDRV